MRSLIDIDKLQGENTRLIQKSMIGEHSSEPKELWKVQLLYRNQSNWLEICRADNYPHKGKAGAHIHVGRRIIFEELATIKQAKFRVWEIGRARIKEIYNKDIGDLI